MKKVLLLLSSVALLATANAQEAAAESTSSESSSFKQEAGDKTLEFQFQSPFASGSPFNLVGGELRFRQFKSETFALRAGVFVSYQTTQDALTVLKDEDGKQTESWADATRNTVVNFRPGFEMHFDGTDKLSPYVGAVASIGYDKQSVINREGVDGDNVAVTDANYKDFSKVLKQKTRTGNFNFGLNAVAGFDYYFTKKLYIGAEMGFGFTASRAFGAKTSGDFTDPDKGGVFAGKEGEVVKGGITTGTLAPNVTGAFRLGFAF